LHKVSVVIRALNEGDHLGRLLDGLDAQTRPPDEVVVVDSGSTDETVEIARARGCKVVQIEKADFSFGRSLNKGCHAASGDILLVMSAHVYPIFDTYVEHMIAPFENGAASITYGRQLGDHRTKFSERRIMLQWFPEESIWDQGHPFSNNANAAVRRDVWERFRYDESLTGLEDLEFAKRVIAAGMQISYVAEAPVVHVHEESWSTIRNRYRREAIAYRRIMERPPMSRSSAVGLALLSVGSDYVHAVRSGKFFANILSIPRFRIAQFYGAWEGFRTESNLSVELLRRFYYPTEQRATAQEQQPGRPINYSATVVKGVLIVEDARNEDRE